MKNNKTKNNNKNNSINNTYTYEQLFASKQFNQNYQRDISKVVLGDKQYTVDDAKRILDIYFHKNKK